jgi:hypothetical protein
VGAPPGTLTGAPPKVGALGKVGALDEGPEIVVFRQVGSAFVVPTDGQLYVPTDGAVTVPYPAVSGCLGQRGRARERDGSGQRDCREFHGCVLSSCIS